jgi:hypothetical protein
MDHQSLENQHGRPVSDGHFSLKFIQISISYSLYMALAARPLILFLIALFLVSLQAQAQEESKKFLLLQHGSKQKSRLIFEIGEEISYKSKKFDFFITDVIVDIQPDLVVLKENVLSPADITAIDIRHKDPRNATVKNMAYLGMGAGAILLLTTTINSLYQQGDLSQATDLLPLSGGLIVGGFVISKMQYKTFKQKGKNKIQAVVLYGE